MDINTIRLLAAIAAAHSPTICQADIASACLNEEIDEDVYMYQPTGYKTLSEDGDELVCLLKKKAIYGLKQSGRKWWFMLHNHIISMGLDQSGNDTCLYYLRNDKDFACTTIYVDDILPVCSSSNLRGHLLNQLQQKFETKII